MKKFYLIHGFEGFPNGGWRPWLMGELFKNKCFAVSLSMPNPKVPVVSEWINKIQEEIGEINEEKYLVGHSLGVPAILRYLETIPEGEKIGGCFLVSGVFEKINTDLISLIDNFLEKPFDFDHIKKVCDKFYIIHNIFDDHVPFSHAESFSNELNVPITKIERENDGHLGDIPYCDELPELLDLILKNIN